jgi:hypothetical protein
MCNLGAIPSVLGVGYTSHCNTCSYSVSSLFACGTGATWRATRITLFRHVLHESAYPGAVVEGDLRRSGPMQGPHKDILGTESGAHSHPVIPSGTSCVKQEEGGARDGVLRWSGPLSEE